MTEKEIYGVCRECGIAANVLTCIKRYGKRPDKLCFDVGTSSIGKCDYCGKEGMKTPTRDFFYPEFELLDKVKTILFNPKG